MLIWIAFALLTGLALLGILWPLSRAMPAATPDADVAFYNTTVADIDRDVARALMTPADAEVAKAEAGRRLLRVARPQQQRTPMRWGRVVAALASLVVVPAVTLGLYGFIGHPDLPDAPLNARLNADPAHMEFAVAVAKIEQHLREAPNDGAGYDLLAPIYLRTGRPDDAAAAYRQAARLLGASPERWVGLGQSLMASAKGRVTADARDAFAKALALSPSLPQARFYLGVAAVQNGDIAGARDTWTRLLADAPPNAPWRPDVAAQLASLDRPAGVPTGAQADAIAALPSGDQQAAIHSMVDGLAARLQQDGRDPEGWLRLVRAYSVLRENDKAKLALGNARRELAGDSGALARLDALEHELGLGA